MVALESQNDESAMIHREDAEQKALIDWADLVPMPPGLALHRGAKVGEYLFAVPNGGARGRIEAARLKGLGVRSGVSDLFFSFPSPGAPPKHGLYIEMKAPKPHGARVTANQHAFQERMLFAGYAAVICFGWDAARRAISMYLKCDL